MVDIAVLRDLRDRVWAGAPDRELDGRIMFGLFAKPCGEKGYIWPEDNPSWVFAFRFSQSSKMARKDIGETIEWRREDGDYILMNSLRVPKLTASFDEAISLIKLALPGWCWKVGTCSVSDDAWVAPDRNGPAAHLLADRLFDAGFDVDRRPSGQPALALIEAMLDALIAIEERGNGGGSDAMMTDLNRARDQARKARP